MKNKRILVAIICIVCAALVATAAIVTQKISFGNKSEVVVLTANVKKGEKITTNKVQLEERTSSEISDTAVTSIEAVVGNYATADLFALDAVTPEKISKTPVNGDNLIAEMSEDKIAVSVPLTGANGVNGKLESGDIVQVYIKNPEYSTANDERRKEMEEYLLMNELQYMRVLSITFSENTEDGTKADGGTYDVVTFECSPEQVQKLLEASDHGMHLGYICHGNDERAQGLLNAQQDLNASIANS